MPETSVPSFWQQNAVEQYIYKDFTSRHTYPLRNQFSHLYESFRKGKFIKFKRQKVDRSTLSEFLPRMNSYTHVSSIIKKQSQANKVYENYKANLI